MSLNAYIFFCYCSVSSEVAVGYIYICSFNLNHVHDQVCNYRISFPHEFIHHRLQYQTQIPIQNCFSSVVVNLSEGLNNVVLEKLRTQAHEQGQRTERGRYIAL